MSETVMIEVLANEVRHLSTTILKLEEAVTRQLERGEDHMQRIEARVDENKTDQDKRIARVEGKVMWWSGVAMGMSALLSFGAKLLNKG